jgi:hypothetical protein
MEERLIVHLSKPQTLAFILYRLVYSPNNETDCTEVLEYVKEHYPYGKLSATVARIVFQYLLERKAVEVRLDKEASRGRGRSRKRFRLINRHDELIRLASLWEPFANKFLVEE